MSQYLRLRFSYTGGKFSVAPPINLFSETLYMMLKKVGDVQRGGRKESAVKRRIKCLTNG